MGLSEYIMRQCKKAHYSGWSDDEMSDEEKGF